MQRPPRGPDVRSFSCPTVPVGMASGLAWLGTALAAHGFIAVAVNHPGNNALEDYTVEGFSLWWLRAVDLSAVIDAVLDDKTFGSQIDPARIGAAGHSAGGYTVIAVAGGISDPGAAPGVLPLTRSRRVVQTAARKFPTCAKRAWRA